MTRFFVHGIEGLSQEEEAYVELTTPVGLSEALTREAFAGFTDPTKIADSVTLYELVPVGALRDGLPD